jgi:hypothetical protein
LSITHMTMAARSSIRAVYAIRSRCQQSRMYMDSSRLPSCLCVFGRDCERIFGL